MTALISPTPTFTTTDDPVLATMNALQGPDAMRQQAASLVMALWAARLLDRKLLLFEQHGRIREYRLSTALSDTFRLAIDKERMVLGVPALLWPWFCWVPWQKAVYHTRRSYLYLTAPGTAGYIDYLSITVRRTLWDALSRHWSQGKQESQIELVVRNLGDHNCLDERRIPYEAVQTDAVLFRDADRD